jgi:hypothetical protein
LFGITKIKILCLGMLLALPPVIALKSGEKKNASASSQTTKAVATETSAIQIPVEVISKGGKAEWVMVEVATEAVPEPATITLMMTLGSLMLLRRQRKE